MSLKDITWDLHKEAEQNKFAQLLLSGTINDYQYAMYLTNMLMIYIVLENTASEHGLLDDINDIKRSDAIKADLENLELDESERKSLKPMASTVFYISHISDLVKINPNRLMAHIYVRHFGDLYGGQILKKKVPGTGTMYEFNNRQELIAKTREKLTDDLGPEARKGFQFAIDVFKDLVNELNL